MKNIVAGNVISLVAAVFTFASAWSRDRKRVYLYQAVQCLIMAAANIFFFSVSGVTTFILCAIRNLLLAYDRFTGKLCIVFVILVGALGLAANNRGAIGLLPVVTTAVYTVGCLFAVRPKTIKAPPFTVTNVFFTNDLLCAASRFSNTGLLMLRIQMGKKKELAAVPLFLHS